MLSKMENFLGSWYGRVFLSALTLRVFLLPLFFHPDLKIIFYNSSFLSQGVWNIYDFLAKNNELAFLGPFVYPPLTYFFFGFLEFLLAPFAGVGWSSWLASGNEAVTSPLIFRFLFLAKLPLLVFDLAIAFVLVKFFKEEAEKKLAFAFWLFNPISLFGTSVLGQFDVIPTFLVALSLWFFAKGRYYQSSLALGVGAAFKSFPLLLLPFLAILASQDLKRRVKIFAVGLLPYLVFVAPYLRSHAFKESVLLSGLSQRIFISGIDLGFGEHLPLIVISWVLLFFLAYSKTSSAYYKRGSYSFYAGSLFLLVLAFSHFHPQWAVWAAPFLSFWAARNPALRLPIVLLVVSFFGVVFLFPDRFLGFALLSPLDPGVLFLPPAREALVNVFDPQLLQNLSHAVLAASSLWIIFRLAEREVFGKGER